MAFCLKSEACSLECCLEMFSAIDEKHGGFDIVFLPQFVKKEFGETDRSGRK